MGNSNLVIALVVGIIVVKLVAVHLYLKKKIDQSEKSSAQSTEDKNK